MRKSLLVEIDVTHADASCVIAIQMVEMENRSEVKRQLLIKRSSRSDFMCDPDVGEGNFVLSVTEKISES